MEFLPDSGHAVPIESGETMSRRPRRNHTPGFKAKVALAAISGDRVEDCRKIGVQRAKTLAARFQANYPHASANVVCRWERGPLSQRA